MVPDNLPSILFCKNMGVNFANFSPVFHLPQILLEVSAGGKWGPFFNSLFQNQRKTISEYIMQQRIILQITQKWLSITDSEYG